MIARKLIRERVKLLVDTHVVLWWLDTPRLIKRLGVNGSEAIDDVILTGSMADNLLGSDDDPFASAFADLRALLKLV